MQSSSVLVLHVISSKPKPLSCGTDRIFGDAEAAGLNNSIRNGTMSAFGALQAVATKPSSLSMISAKPCNRPNFYAQTRLATLMFQSPVSH
jgi:hypothetical protein